MRTFKKVAAIFMTVAMVMGCVSCGSRSANLEKLKIEQPTTINVWYDNDAYTPYLDYVTSQLSKANEMVTVNSVLVHGTNYIEDIYQESVHNSNVADVYLLSSEYLQKACLMGLVAENDTYSSTYTDKRYGSSAVKAATYKDKLYGYPLSFNTGIMVYNTKHVSPVNTFTELTSYSDSFKIDDNNKDVQIVATWDVSNMLTNYAFAAPYMAVGGDSGEDSSVMTINQDKLKEAMTEFGKLKAAYGINRSEVDQDFCINKFTEGKLLYTIIESDRLKELDDSDVQYGVCSIPAITSNLESRALSETTLALVSPYSSSLDAAKSVAQAISYDYADKLYEYTGLASARNDSTYKNKDAYKALYDIYSGSAVKADYVGADEAYLRYEIMIHQIWDGTSVDTALDTFINKK